MMMKRVDILGGPAAGATPHGGYPGSRGMHRPTRQTRADRKSDTDELHLSFRLIRTLLGVAEYRNITRAAKELNHSQASITKQIQLLEQKLGAPLFDRTTKGMTLTAYGAAFLPRASASAAAFRQVRSLAPKQTGQPSSGAAHFYNMDVSDRWLAALLAVTEHQNVTEAAHRMDISTAAVLASLKKLERSFGLQLFAREANRLVPTPFAAALAQCVRIAANELALARHELASLRGGQRGRVTVGALPYARTMIVPRSITRLLERHEHIEVTTFEDNYPLLLAALRSGDLDVIVGALRGLNEDDLVETPLFHDRLALIVRAGHPLLNGSRLDWRQLANYEWLLPKSDTPMRQATERVLQVIGIKPSRRAIETGCPVTMRGLLVDSDRVTLAPRHQIHYEERAGVLASIPVDHPQAAYPIGLTTRAGSTLSPATTVFIEQICQVAAELEAERHRGNGGRAGHFSEAPADCAH